MTTRIYSNMRWTDYGDTSYRKRSRDELSAQYNNCSDSLPCKYIIEDYIFTCTRAASLYYLGAVDTPYDRLRITEQTTKQDILDFYLHEYGDICSYCDHGTNKEQVIPAGIQSGNRKIFHSKYTVISNYELNHYRDEAKLYEQMMGRGLEQKDIWEKTNDNK